MGFPQTRHQHDSVWVIVDRMTKSAHFLPFHTSYSSEDYTKLYIKELVRLNRVPLSIISDRVSIQMGVGISTEWTQGLGHTLSDEGVILRSHPCVPELCIQHHCSMRVDEVDKHCSHETMHRGLQWLYEKALVWMERSETSRCSVEVAADIRGIFDQANKSFHRPIVPNKQYQQPLRMRGGSRRERGCGCGYSDTTVHREGRGRGCGRLYGVFIHEGVGDMLLLSAAKPDPQAAQIKTQLDNMSRFITISFCNSFVVYRADMPSGMILSVKSLKSMDKTIIHHQSKMIKQDFIEFAIYKDVVLLLHHYYPNGMLELQEFLHHVAIIHLDVSLGNVFLDSKVTPLVVVVEIS
ncbi:hypothetical protein FXO38_17868 [Capsicum annuum]|nr:hypothetical protein FXO38_17868 [Capsicum annuum]